MPKTASSFRDGDRDPPQDLTENGARMLRAAAVGALVAAAAGWVAYEQVDASAHLFALIVVFYGLLATVTLGMLSLAVDDDLDAAMSDPSAPELPTVVTCRSNGNGSPRVPGDPHPLVDTERREKVDRRVLARSW
ncbi:MAG: hypothetical protein ABI794_09030 [Betaproteobacteria bacterium]